MLEKLSGQQLAANNLQKFLAWVNERGSANDWIDYIRNGKLNRSEIANECGFALSVVRQNPAVKKALEALEVRLLTSGVLQPKRIAPGASDEAGMNSTSQAIDKRIVAAKTKAEQRVKQLEEQNASLKAEIRNLRDQLKQYRHLDEHLCATGRFLHP